jgi:hypothetical protein
MLALLSQMDLIIEKTRKQFSSTHTHRNNKAPEPAANLSKMCSISFVTFDSSATSCNIYIYICPCCASATVAYNTSRHVAFHGNCCIRARIFEFLGDELWSHNKEYLFGCNNFGIATSLAAGILVAGTAWRED